MKNKSGMPQLLGLVLQILGLILLMIMPRSVVPVGLVIFGAVIVLIAVALSKEWSLSSQYLATMTLFSLILILFYGLFGFRISTNALMLAGLATAFVIEVTSKGTMTDIMPRKNKKAYQINEEMDVPSVETYYEEIIDLNKPKDNFTEKKLDDEKQRIIDELSDIQEEIVTIADDDIDSKKEGMKMFFGKKDGKTYHAIDCISLKNSNRKDLRVFNSTYDAKKSGYKPCRICI